MKKNSKNTLKDGASSSVRDDKQQEISESKWCTWAWIRRGKKKSNNKKKEESDNENIWIIIKSTI